MWAPYFCWSLFKRGQKLLDILIPCPEPHSKRRSVVCQGDLLLLGVGEPAAVDKALDRVRQFLAAELGEVDPSAQALLWVTDFPFAEWDEEEQRFQAMHHPFTAPVEAEALLVQT